MFVWKDRVTVGLVATHRRRGEEREQGLDKDTAVPAFRSAPSDRAAKTQKDHFSGSKPQRSARRRSLTAARRRELPGC